VKKILSLTSLAVVLGLISWGSALNAQNTPSTTPDPQAQQPSPDAAPSQQTPQTQPTPSPEMPPSSQQTPSSQTPSSQSPSQTPDTTAPESGAKSGSSASDTAAGTQTFSGTVVKQGDKYVLKDDAGKTYDIDHQSDVAKFEGKRVRVQGTLDSNGKILVK
jgi:cytoskeletal protein RodZ